MISQRVQAAVVVLFVLVIAGVVAMLLMRAERDAPAAQARQPTPATTLSRRPRPGRSRQPHGRQGRCRRAVHGRQLLEAGGPKLELSENQGRDLP